MMIKWWKPSINLKNFEKIKDIAKRGWPNQGKYSNRLENKIKSLLKVKHCLTCTSGTSAIYLAIKALKLKKNSEILLPNISYAAAGNAIISAGYKVKLVDVEKKLPVIDLNDLKKKISNRTKAIIVVHISGRSNNFQEIFNLCRKKGIIIIEDAAEALFSKLNKKYLGTIGDIGCYSLSPNKIITSGQGGLIVTNNSRYFNYISRFKDQGRNINTTGGSDTHYHLGFNFKYTDLQAAITLSQIEDINKKKKKLIENYKLYKKFLVNNKKFFILPFELKKGNLPLWIDCYCADRNKLMKFLDKFQIPVRKFWYSLNSQNEFRQKKNKLENSVLLSKKLIWLPSGFSLKKKEILYICNKIKFYYE